MHLKFETSSKSMKEKGIFHLRWKRFAYNVSGDDNSFPLPSSGLTQNNQRDGLFQFLFHVVVVRNLTLVQASIRRPRLLDLQGPHIVTLIVKGCESRVLGITDLADG